MCLSKNTKPELAIRSLLWSKGYRYKIHDKKLPGKPDIVLPKHKDNYQYSRLLLA
jgi:DNA mismatch endonuclease (patch repair protein)